MKLTTILNNDNRLNENLNYEAEQKQVFYCEKDSERFHRKSDYQIQHWYDIIHRLFGVDFK